MGQTIDKWNPVNAHKGPEITHSKAFWGEDENVRFEFYASGTWVDFRVTEVNNVLEEEEVATGYIKWDGCSQWDFDGLHLCGPYHYKRLFRIMEQCYRLAYELGDFTEEPWDEEE